MHARHLQILGRGCSTHEARWNSGKKVLLQLLLLLRVLLLFLPLLLFLHRPADWSYLPSKNLSTRCLCDSTGPKGHQAECTTLALSIPICLCPQLDQVQTHSLFTELLWHKISPDFLTPTSCKHPHKVDPVLLCATLPYPYFSAPCTSPPLAYD